MVGPGTAHATEPNRTNARAAPTKLPLGHLTVGAHCSVVFFRCPVGRARRVLATAIAQVTVAIRPVSSRPARTSAGGCATSSTMRRIGVRELRRHASRYLRDVQQRGATIEVTDRGRPVALLVP